MDGRLPLLYSLCWAVFSAWLAQVYLIGPKMTYANCSTTAQRGALDWRHAFREATAPVFEKLYKSVESGEETRVVIEANSKPDYQVGLDKELKEMRESEMWQAGAAVRSLRPENWKK